MVMEALRLILVASLLTSCFAFRSSPANHANFVTSASEQMVSPEPTNQEHVAPSSEQMVPPEPPNQGRFWWRVSTSEPSTKPTLLKGTSEPRTKPTLLKGTSEPSTKPTLLKGSGKYIVQAEGEGSSPPLLTSSPSLRASGAHTIEDGSPVEGGVAVSKSFLNNFDNQEYVEVFSNDTGKISHLLTSDISVKGAPAVPLKQACKVVAAACQESGSFVPAVQAAFRQYADLPAFGQRRMGGGEDFVEWFSWRSVKQKADRILTIMHTAGVAKNGRVIILAENRVEIAVVMLACFMGEYIPATLHYNFGDDAVRHAVEEVQAAAAFVDTSRMQPVAKASGTDLRLLVTFESFTSDQAEKARALQKHVTVASFHEVVDAGSDIMSPCAGGACPEQPQPAWAADTALLLFTSGSTGMPKSAMVSRQGMFVEACGALDPSSCPEQSSVHIMNSQMSTSATPYEILINHLTAGRTAIFMPVEDMYSVARLVWPTGMSGTPEVFLTLYANYESDLAMTTEGEDRRKVAKKYNAAMGPRVQSINCGGAKPNPAVMKWLMETFPNATVSENYASTEAGPITFKANGVTRLCNPKIQLRLEPFGDYRPTDVPPRGELLVKSPTVFAGYLDESKTNEAFTEDGWYMTGDIVQMVENKLGELVPVVIDRKKSTFKLKNGEWVSPAKVENRLEASPLVQQAFVYGDSRATAIVALVVATKGAEDLWRDRVRGSKSNATTFQEAVMRSLREACEEPPVLRHFEVPKQLHIVSEPFRHQPKDPENDLLTPTEKKNRARIEAKYKKELEAMMTSLANEILHAMQEKAQMLIGLLERILQSPEFSLPVDTTLDAFRISSVEAMFLEGRLQAHFKFESGQFPGLLALLLDNELVSIARGISKIQHGEAADIFEETLDYWREEVTLPDDLPWPSANGSSTLPAPNLMDHAILLTGATSFVGKSLLRDILGSPSNATVYCLVRGVTPEKAADRLQKQMADQGYTEALGDAWHRVRVVTGDFTQRNLGIDPSVHALLAEEVGTIFHVGSLVDHVLSYKRLKGPNVGSVLDVLRLAVTGRLKAVHYCSTYSVLPPGELGDETSLGGGLPTDVEGLAKLAMEMAKQGAGYVLSKYIGEVLTRAARHRGVPTFIHRLSMISFDTHTGAANTGDWIVRFFQGAVQLQKFYIKPGTILWTTPVDYLSRSMLALAKDPPAGLLTYQQPEFKMNPMDLMKQLGNSHALSSNGRSLQALDSVWEWRDLWVNLPHENAMYPLRHYFEKGLSGYHKSNSNVTLWALTRMFGFKDPKLTEEGLEKLASSLLIHADSGGVQEFNMQVKDPISGALCFAVDANAWSPEGGPGGEEESFLLDQLSPDEAATVQGLPAGSDTQILTRKEKLLGFLLSKYAVATALRLSPESVEIHRPHQLKPFVAEATLGKSPLRSSAVPNFNFNVGHEGGWVVFASDGIALIGTDVASAKTFDGQTAATIISHYNSSLAPSERELLLASAFPSRVFAMLWSLKEAFVKARGDGLAFGALSGAVFELKEGSKPQLVLNGRRASEWEFELLELPHDMWFAVARGPPDVMPDKADPLGDFRKTLRKRSVGKDRVAWAKFQGRELPKFRVVGVEDLLSADVREAYQQVSGQSSGIFGNIRSFLWTVALRIRSLWPF